MKKIGVLFLAISFFISGCGKSSVSEKVEDEQAPAVESVQEPAQPTPEDSAEVQAVKAIEGIVEPAMESAKTVAADVSALDLDTSLGEYLGNNWSWSVRGPKSEYIYFYDRSNNLLGKRKI